MNEDDDESVTDSKHNSENDPPTEDESDAQLQRKRVYEMDDDDDELGPKKRPSQARRPGRGKSLSMYPELKGGGKQGTPESSSRPSVGGKQPPLSSSNTRPTTGGKGPPQKGSHSGGGGKPWTMKEFNLLRQLVDSKMKFVGRELVLSEWNVVANQMHSHFASRMVKVGDALVSGYQAREVRSYPQRSTRVIRCYATKDDGLHKFYPHYKAMCERHVKVDGSSRGDDKTKESIDGT